MNNTLLIVVNILCLCVFLYYIGLLIFIDHRAVTLRKKQKWATKEYALLQSSLDLAEAVRNHYRVMEDSHNVMYHLAMYEQKILKEKNYYNKNKKWIDA